MQTKPKLIVFDVNETLLDLNPLKSKVNQALGNHEAFDVWFSMLLHYSLVETVTNTYSDFSSIANATFKMVSQKFEVDISDEKIASILSTIKSLPPHSDVIEALTHLEKEGFTMVALTNGNQGVAENQLKYAGLDSFFKNIISVEHVKRYKPHANAYRFVLDKMSTPAEDTLMVAAHGWDIVGGKRAGMKTAFIMRKGKFMYPLGERPDLTGKTVLEVAKKLTDF